MKNISIRARILAGIVLVNLIGAVVVVIYLHQSYSGGLDVTAERAVTLGVASFEGLQQYAADEFGSTTDPKGSLAYVEQMKALTGADYGVLLDKQTVKREDYAKARVAAGMADNWDEGGDTYVLAATTDDALAEKELQFSTPAGDVPDAGKIIGIENGACSKTCHGSMTKQGDYWGVTWSDDSKSRSHVVFPISEGGKVVGVIIGIEDISAQADSAKSSMINTLFVFALTLLLATVIIGGMLDALIFRRLGAMIHSMEDISVRVAGGDFDAHFQPDGTTDEIGTFETFFGKFLDLMSSTLKTLTGR
ncbi:MAG: hypothetical protein C0418_02240 [Coriobacteriaceae bacterium]|nr:hypothetical protein [Coriobacteriaceae bacterium]